MIKGGLSVVSVLAGMFFAAISGSGAATTAAVGATLVPELKKRGYREDSAAALVAAAGTIGVVIPPSVPMVLYAVIAEESVSRLFSAGFMPGVIMGLMLIAISLYQAYKNNYPKGAPFSPQKCGQDLPQGHPRPADARDHPRRHLLRLLHPVRSGGRGRRLRAAGFHVRLSRYELQKCSIPPCSARPKPAPSS